MGVLDDAIREHLELKRRHGAPDSELKRQAAEALGPARREPKRVRPEDLPDQEAAPPTGAAAEAPPRGRVTDEQTGERPEAVEPGPGTTADRDEPEPAGTAAESPVGGGAAGATSADRTAAPDEVAADEGPVAAEERSVDTPTAGRPVEEEREADEVPADEVLETPPQQPTGDEAPESPASTPSGVFDVESLEAEPAEHPPAAAPRGVTPTPSGEDASVVEEPTPQAGTTRRLDPEDDRAYVEAELVDEELVDESELEDEVLDDTDLLDDDLVVESGPGRAPPATPDSERPVSFEEDTVLHSPAEPPPREPTREEHRRALEDEYGTDEEDLGTIHGADVTEPPTTFTGPTGAGLEHDERVGEERLADEDELEEAERAAEEALAADEGLTPEPGLSPDEEDVPPADSDAPSAAAGSEGDEDVLEETPDFLQETPEDERLWFEQRPPRDFDLDR